MKFSRLAMAGIFSSLIDYSKLCGDELESKMHPRE